MGITVEWYQYESLKPVIYWTFDGVWDWNDFNDADYRAYNMAAEADRRVHSIVDMRASAGVPRTGAVSYFSRSVKTVPPNRDQVIIVGVNSLLRSFEPILRRLYPRASSNYRIANTPEEAFAMLIAFEHQIAE